MTESSFPPRATTRSPSAFLSRDPSTCRHQQAILEGAVMQHGQRVLGWRTLPFDGSALGPHRARHPAGDAPALHRAHLPRERSSEPSTSSASAQGVRPTHDDFYIASCSSRTVVYKGLMLAEQVGLVLPRSHRRAHRQQAGHGALALLHQHVSRLGARAPVPPHRPQRRDQHSARQ